MIKRKNWCDLMGNLKLGILSILIFVLILNFVYAENCYLNDGNQSSCESDSTCFWDSFGNWCQDRGCWNLYDQSDCSNSTEILNLSCNWRTGNANWCQAADCWIYDGTDENTCETNTAGLACEWNEECHGGPNCWNIDNQNTCQSTSGCSWGGCFRKGCWDYETQNECSGQTGIDGRDCAWDSSSNHCYQQGCSAYTSQSICTDNGCVWDRGSCIEGGCWTYSFTNQSTCEGSGLNCQWSDPFCQELGCWSLGNESSCQASSENCQWVTDTGGWCEQLGCWSFDGTDNDTCESSGLGCAWSDNNDPINSCEAIAESCGDLSDTDQDTCELSGLNCNWNDPVCEAVNCSDFDGTDENSCISAGSLCSWNDPLCIQFTCDLLSDTDQATCEGLGNFGLYCAWADPLCNPVNCDDYSNSDQNTCEFYGCSWDQEAPEGPSGWCYYDWSAVDCSSITNQKQCYDTYYCWWDLGQSTCQEPESDVGFTAWNPSCYIFNNNQTTCGLVNGCEWDDVESECTASEIDVALNGISCENVSDSNLCNSISVLSNCCSWQAGNCTTNRFSTACWDNQQTPPEGANFCEDWAAYTSQTLCEQIANDPWYMPCVWDSNSQRCKFNDAAFGGSVNFDDITNLQGCELAGGRWIQEFYCSGENSIPTGRCEYKFDEETNCNRACHACESRTDGSEWGTLGNAKDACENSDLGYCEFKQDPNAPNSFGWCDPKAVFLSGSAGSCDSDCRSCTFIGSINEGGPQAACQASSANCRWHTDPLDSSRGECRSSDEKSCEDECSKCYEQESCVNYGKGGDGVCTWDTSGGFCKTAGGSDEICYDGSDNDGDGSIDCADNNCLFDPFCGFTDSGNCWGYSDQNSCETNNCAWLVESHGDNVYQECAPPGAECWQLDGNQTACEERVGVCVYFAGGICEPPEENAQSCFAAGNQSSCEAINGCNWNEDPWCLSHPNDPGCQTSTGWCDSAAFSCWINTNETSCTSNSYCRWTNDTHSPTGGWCDNSCFASHDQNSCEGTEISSGVNCEWVGGLCDPAFMQSFGGSAAGYGVECWLFDGNETSCDSQEGCSWTNNNNAFCGIDFTYNCYQYGDQGSCDLSPGCKWAGSWCDGAATECGWNQSLQADQATCESNPLCGWTNNGQGGWCDAICFGANKNSCQSITGCLWNNGLCEAEGNANFHNQFETRVGEPVDLGDDPTGDSTQDHVDITGWGYGDMGNQYAFGMPMVDMSQAALCKGTNLPTGVGVGTSTGKYYVYLDTDGSTTGNCATKHDNENVGKEFFFSMKSEFDSSTGKSRQTFTAQRCVDGAWGATDIVLSTLEKFACEEVGGAIIIIDKKDLEKYNIYNPNAVMGVEVAAADTDGNAQTPSDTVSASGYVTPGTSGFSSECCWTRGADCNSNGLPSEIDPECSSINKQGFIQFEDCYTNTDNNGDGLAGCFDYSCLDNNYCVQNQLGLNDPDYVDTTTPKVVNVRTEVYPDSALISYDTNKPSSGQLLYYGTDSACRTSNLVATVNDIGLISSDVKDYKLWHEGLVYDDDGVDSLTDPLAESTTYYYKLKVCDSGNRCGSSACSSFTTTNIQDCKVCNFVTRLNVPTDWEVSYDIDQDGTFEVQGVECNNPQAGVLTTYLEGRNADLRLTNTESSSYITFRNARITKSALNEKIKTLNGAGSIIQGTLESGAGYAGLPSSTRDKIINTLHPQTCELRIPGDGTCEELWHCDDNLENCIDRTDESILLETGEDYCEWQIPYCEFSTWAGGDPSSDPPSNNPSGSSSAASGGGGGNTGSPSRNNPQINQELSESGEAFEDNSKIVNQDNNQQEKIDQTSELDNNLEGKFNFAMVLLIIGVLVLGSIIVFFVLKNKN
ncbi:hypothetical protein J4216_03715 [Candidatus Woesearchaeota archaeon]|nr:hypothetical protein [Candidatus Woesearchaeota archaeon]